MRIGIDLGGTKIAGIVLDDSGRECARHRVPTPSLGYTDILDALSELITTLGQSAGIDPALYPIGIGSPGAISPATGLMKNSNTTCINGKPFLDDLRARFGSQVTLANDANCFALSEATDGAGQGAETVFGVILGTGVGAGLIVNQRPIVGCNAIAGEWGHNLMPGAGEGRSCYCGKKDCIETYLSGSGLALTHRRLSAERFSAEEIARMGQRGDARASATLERYCRQLAEALSVVINIVDPQVIVLGGGLSNIPRLYRRLPELLPEHVFSDQVATRILPPRYGDDSGVRGAAWL